MLRKTVPIVSGNVKYLGLSVPEWVLALSPFTFYMIFPLGDALRYVIGGHILIIMIYVAFFAKLEENLFGILMANRRIPQIVYGYFRSPTPIKKILRATSLYRQ